MMTQAKKYILAFLAALSILLSLLLAATMIPHEKIQSNFQESAEYMEY